MANNGFNNLIENKTTDYNTGETDFLMLAKYKELLKDTNYFDFIIESENGGFFFGPSLQIYQYASSDDFNDIQYVNSLLKNEFGEIFNHLIAFGQDLFGNQFCFDISNGNIIFFNSETGERSVMAPDFSGWIDALYQQFDFYIGLNLLNDWLAKNKLGFNERLCPSKPFVMGGEYETNNLYAGTFPGWVKAYANIAKQVYNLPDGTPVKLVIDKK